MYRDTDYSGRFAPSPSGPLHFGSLVAALASYLDARAADGKWRLRIEDIDPPRSMAGASDQILHCLQAHGLTPDQPVIFQSDHQNLYDAALQRLHQKGLTYYCRCTRKQIREGGGHDNLACRERALSDDEGTAVRFISRANQPEPDLIQKVSHNLPGPDPIDDPILRRRDGLYGYPLAVAVDDLNEGYSHIIRGADLLEFTALQCEIIRALDGTPPLYGHIPVVTNREGQKLSKQNHALPVSESTARENLLNALAFLGQRLDKAAKADSIGGLLEIATQGWRRERIPRQPGAIWPPTTC